MPDQQPLRRPYLFWLFPVVTILHNSEEAIWLPSWSQHAGWLHPPVGAFEFRFAVVVLTLLAFVLTSFAVRGHQGALYFTAAYWVAMLGNVFFPHLTATLIQRSYTPGVITAVALNLPVDSYLLWSVLRDGTIKPKSLARATVIFLPALVVSIPALFWLGRQLAR